MYPTTVVHQYPVSVLSPYPIVERDTIPVVILVTKSPTFSLKQHTILIYLSRIGLLSFFFDEMWEGVAIIGTSLAFYSGNDRRFKTSLLSYY